MDLISRMSLKTAENGNFWAQLESFDWFLHPKCDIKNFVWINMASSPPGRWGGDQILLLGGAEIFMVDGGRKANGGFQEIL